MQRLTLLFAALVAFVCVAQLNAAVVQLPMHKRALNPAGLRDRREFVERKTKLQAARSFNPKFAQKLTGGKAHKFVTTQYPSDFFLVNVQLGTSAQTFTVAVDSFDLSFWVLDTTYQGAVSDSQHLYNVSASSTGRKSGEDYEYFYYSGFVYGFVDTDVFSIAGLTYKKQDFGAIYQIDDDFGPYPVDGLIGLGVPEPDDPEDYHMPLANIADQLASPSYTIWLGNHVPPSVGTIQGLLTLGGADTDNCKNDGNAVQQYYNDYFWVWLFNIDYVKIGKYEDDVTHYGFLNVGLPTISVPDTELRRIFSTLNPSYDQDLQIYHIPCKNTYMAPDISLTIGGVEYTVPGTDYILDLDLADGECVVALDDWDADDTWVLGVPFMQAVCTQVDFQNHVVTFSTALH
ncbi:Asp-1 [Aphelenchoides fujianensis]|nr:Asp-1 [Aphelenchoides fujianensis]